VIGDSSSGKTALCLSALAEAANHPLFDNHRLIMDDVENANEFDMEEIFGKRMASRVEPPDWIDTGEEDEKGNPIRIPDPSETIQEFWINIMDAIEDPDERPFIYVLDSLDAIDAKEDQEKFDEMRAAYKKGKEAKGSYGMAKAKGMSGLLRGIKKKLKNSDSILIIISQTRDKVEQFGFGKKRSRSGGRALKFYCTHEIWLAMIGGIKSKGVVIGNQVEADVSKNKITGKRRIVQFPIYEGYGVDDTKSCIEYLLDQGHWKKKKNTIIATELRMEFGMEKLIQEIEEKGKQEKLRRIVGSVWKKIENDVKLKRRPKYE
jgi:RecA/RadA recombinase